MASLQRMSFVECRESRNRNAKEYRESNNKAFDRVHDLEWIEEVKRSSADESGDRKRQAFKTKGKDDIEEPI
jgi:hypothetical protein